MSYFYDVVWVVLLLFGYSGPITVAKPCCCGLFIAVGDSFGTLVMDMYVVYVLAVQILINEG